MSNEPPEPTSPEPTSPEPVQDVLDAMGVPFRTSMRELIETFGDGDQRGSRIVCTLPMTLGFVTGQEGALAFATRRSNDLDQAMGPLRGVTPDYDAAVADLTARFGEPAVQWTAPEGHQATWRLGEYSKIQVTTKEHADVGRPRPCRFWISSGYHAPLSPVQEEGLDNYVMLDSHATNSFGWTEAGGKRWLMKLTDSRKVRLIDPADIAYLQLVEYEKARGEAFSTLDCYMVDDRTHRPLAQSKPGGLVKIAETLRDELQLELTTTSAPSA